MAGDSKPLNITEIIHPFLPPETDKEKHTTLPQYPVSSFGVRGDIHEHVKA